MQQFGVKNSFDALETLESFGQTYHIYNIKKVAAKLGISVDSLPYSLKILLENLLRYEDGVTVTEKDIGAIASWLKEGTSTKEISYRPSRVLMQDFTGVPAVVDLAAMRDATKAKGGDVNKINPQIPVDLVIDHSVQVDKYKTTNALTMNVGYEMNRNRERYRFLKWGQNAFDNFKVVPPGAGICHQVNLEHLADTIVGRTVNGKLYAFPDTVVGTDSHTTMINALNVLGWGVGGIEAEAAMLGQPISMVIPEVIGVKLNGELKEGVTATDLVLTIVKMLREYGVVGKFVEFSGNGLDCLSLADRATISNMAPEYGATCGLFPIDEETMKYLRQTGRSAAQLHLIKNYAESQGLWRKDSGIKYTKVVSLNLVDVEPSLAGPKRPQDKVVLSEMKSSFQKALPELNTHQENVGETYDVGKRGEISNGSVVISAITSCTNTSNPFVMIGAALLAKKAALKGLMSKPWVKTSLAPGSKVVAEYLEQSELQQFFDVLGFNLVGYGCTTCIGNSGPLEPELEKVITDNNLVVASVLSGNRNFEGRVHQLVKANYLASPPLCVAYAITGTIDIDLVNEPLGKDQKGFDVFLKDIWPTTSEIKSVIDRVIKPEMFEKKYANVFDGELEWKEIAVEANMNYSWEGDSTYIKKPPYFEEENKGISNIENANILALLGDSVTTDHISPAGNIAVDSPAAKYLLDNGIASQHFNSYGSRRGNHEVMMRGTFANIRIKNKMADGKEGGYTKYKNEIMPIYDAAMGYKSENKPLVIFAGKEYGTGSSRDWAAKGTKLLGVKAVITESFERIHRSNLVGMGVVPLVFNGGGNVSSLQLDGTEEIDIVDLDQLAPKKQVTCNIKKEGQMVKSITLTCAVYTTVEVNYIKAGGILSYVLDKLNATSTEE